MSEKKIILDLCGGTGSWSKPYKEAGYDVRLVTLPENDVRAYQPPENVYGILAAPPCTEFSVAKGNRPRNYKEALSVVAACMGIIWQCRTAGTLKFWALENPVGQLRQFLGVPHYQFYQWQFGEMKYKHTDIWGYFNEPTPTVKTVPAELLAQQGRLGHAAAWTSSKKLAAGYHGNTKAYSDPKCPDEYKGMHLDRAALRAITPPGFAKAFYKVNK